MFKLTRLTGLLLLAGAAACDGAASDAITSPDASAADGARSAAVVAPSSSDRLLVVRAAGPDHTVRPEFFLHLDAERNLISAHMPSDVCTTGSLSLVALQIVDTPSAIEQRLVQVKGEEVAVSVYDSDSFADFGITGSFDTAGFLQFLLGDQAQFCSFLAGPQRIAEGMVRRVSNLSNANFSISWTGTLEKVGGGSIGLTEIYQLTADAKEPNDASQWRVNTSKILLH